MYMHSSGNIIIEEAALHKGEGKLYNSVRGVAGQAVVMTSMWDQVVAKPTA